MNQYIYDFGAGAFVPVPMGEYAGISRVVMVPTKEIRALIDSAMDVLKRK